MERTGWPKVMEVDGISLLQVAHVRKFYTGPKQANLRQNTQSQTCVLEL